MSTSFGQTCDIKKKKRDVYINNVAAFMQAANKPSSL